MIILDYKLVELPQMLDMPKLQLQMMVQNQSMLDNTLVILLQNTKRQPY